MPLAGDVEEYSTPGLAVSHSERDTFPIFCRLRSQVSKDRESKTTGNSTFREESQGNEVRAAKQSVRTFEEELSLFCCRSSSSQRIGLINGISQINSCC